MRLFRNIMLLLCLFFLLVPQEVPAEDQLEVNITYGIDGKVQIGKGFPVTIKVTNNGDTVSGDLVIFSNPTYEMVGNIVVPIEFPKGEETIVQLSIPGLNDYHIYGNPSNREPLVKFYENGWENGKEIPLKGNTKRIPSYFPENRVVIGALTDSPDSLNVIKTARYNRESIEFLPLTKENIPSDPMGLEVFDVIIINDFQVSTLADNQINALVDWIRSGGHLMISSDAFLQSNNALHELLLLDIEGQTSFSEISFFTAEDEESLPNFENVEIHTGTLRDNVNVVYADHSLPMVMNKQMGFGEVTQFAFNIGSETLINWDGYASWLSDVLQKTVDKDFYGNARYMLDELTYRLGSIVEMYPSSFIPVKTLVILFVVYLIVLIPGLYFLLKKLDKREISWIIIPAVAIISSIAIFVVGAKDRIGGSQVNNMSIVTVDENGMASGYGAFSILTNNGGDYPITIKPGGYKPFPLHRYGYDPYNETYDGYAMVETGRQQAKITYTDVEYWSIRSALGPIQTLETGKLDTDLWVENNQLKGTVTSSLFVDLDEAYLLSGSKSYPLGTIPAGETVNIQIELESKNIQNLIGAPRANIASSVISGYSNPHHYGYSQPEDKESMNEWKKYELLDSAMYFTIQPNSIKQPIIAGFTTDPLTEIEMDKSMKDINSLSVISQVVNVDIRSLEGGEFKLGRDVMTPDVSIALGSSGFIHHNGLMFGDNFLAVDPGTYTLSYQIPVQIDLNTVEFAKLRVRHPYSDGTVFRIYNVNTNEYMELEDSQTIIEENINDYIAEDGTILLEFEKSGSGNLDVNIPTLELEGEYKQ